MKKIFTLLPSLKTQSVFIQNISSKYDELIEGYEDDDEQNKELMKEVYKDFGLKECKLKKLLSCNLSLKDKDIIKLWDGCYKWCVNEIDQIKSWLVQYIYEKRRYKLRERKDKVTSFENLTKGTCINIHNNCETCSMAAEKGHLYCLKYLPALLIAPEVH